MYVLLLLLLFIVTIRKRVIYNSISLGNPKFEGHDYSISELCTAQEQIKRYKLYIYIFF